MRSRNANPGKCALDRWLAPANIEETVSKMLSVDTEQDSVASHRRKRLQGKIAQAEKEKNRFIQSIRDGVRAEYILP